MATSSGRPSEEASPAVRFANCQGASADSLVQCIQGASWANHNTLLPAWGNDHQRQTKSNDEKRPRAILQADLFTVALMSVAALAFLRRNNSHPVVAGRATGIWGTSLGLCNRWGGECPGS